MTVFRQTPKIHSLPLKYQPSSGQRASTSSPCFSTGSSFRIFISGDCSWGSTSGTCHATWRWFHAHPAYITKSCSEGRCQYFLQGQEECLHLDSELSKPQSSFPWCELWKWPKVNNLLMSEIYFMHSFHFDQCKQQNVYLCGMKATGQSGHSIFQRGNFFYFLNGELVRRTLLCKRWLLVAPLTEMFCKIHS